MFFKHTGRSLSKSCLGPDFFFKVVVRHNVKMCLEIYTTIGYIVILFRIDAKGEHPSSRGLVKQYNQELCISPITRCFTKRLQSTSLKWWRCALRLPTVVSANKIAFLSHRLCFIDDLVAGFWKGRSSYFIAVVLSPGASTPCIVISVRDGGKYLPEIVKARPPFGGASKTEQIYKRQINEILCKQRWQVAAVRVNASF